MRTQKRIFTLIMTLLLSCVFCGIAQSEDYEVVSPSELSFGLIGFRADAKTETDEDKADEGEAETEKVGDRILNGTFDKFICEDMELEVVEKKITDGIIETNDYGRMRVSIDSSGGLTVYAMPSQKKKLIDKIRE